MTKLTLDGATADLILISNKKGVYGLIESLVVNENERRQGKGSALLRQIILEARMKGCYKLICTARTSNMIAHLFYRRNGFYEWGKEFRLNLEKADHAK